VTQRGEVASTTSPRHVRHGLRAPRHRSPVVRSPRCDLSGGVRRIRTMGQAGLSCAEPGGAAPRCRSRAGRNGIRCGIREGSTRTPRASTSD